MLLENPNNISAVEHAVEHAAKYVALHTSTEDIISAARISTKDITSAARRLLHISMIGVAPFNHLVQKS